MQQSCAGGESSVNGVVGFGYLTSLGDSASRCQEAFASACIAVNATTTARFSANCESDCSTYRLGCSDSCLISLTSQNGEQYLTFNVQAAHVNL